MKTLDDARVHLNKEIFGPVFFNKLAQLGRAPATDKQADAYLQIGVRLLDIEQQEQVKQAAAGEDDLGAALADLNALSQAFYPQQVDPQTKQACLEWARRSEANTTAGVLFSTGPQA